MEHQAALLRASRDPLKATTKEGFIMEKHEEKDRGPDDELDRAESLDEWLKRVVREAS